MLLFCNFAALTLASGERASDELFLEIVFLGMKISIIGAGAMGGSLVKGLLQTTMFGAADITVADLSQQSLEAFAGTGVRLTSNNHEAAQAGDIIAVVVKPWLVQSVLEDIKTVIDYNRQLIVVIAAGISSAQINEWLSKGNGMVLPTVFLAIPNIAIAMKASMTFVVPVNASSEQTRLITDMFNEMGETLVTDERLLPAGTALASSGLAYAMRYLRAATEGGVEMGFKAGEAQRIVMQTMRGTVELLQTSGMHPEEAIDLVTTPGGVTIKGLNEMEAAGFTSAVVRGLKAGLR